MQTTGLGPWGFLVVIDQRTQSERAPIALTGFTYSLGNDLQNQIPLMHHSVRPSHAKVTYNGRDVHLANSDEPGSIVIWRQGQRIELRGRNAKQSLANMDAFDIGVFRIFFVQKLEHLGEAKRLIHAATSPPDPVPAPPEPKPAPTPVTPSVQEEPPQPRPEPNQEPAPPDPPQNDTSPHANEEAAATSDPPVDPSSDDAEFSPLNWHSTNIAYADLPVNPPVSAPMSAPELWWEPYIDPATGKWRNVDPATGKRRVDPVTGKFTVPVPDPRHHRYINYLPVIFQMRLEEMGQSATRLYEQNGRSISDTIAPSSQDAPAITQPAPASEPMPASEQQTVAEQKPVSGSQLTQQAPLLWRFLQIMEALWEPREWRQDHIEYYFDPRTCPVSFVPWLAQWFGIWLPPEATELQCRRLVARAMRLHLHRGTPTGIEEMITVCTGLTTMVATDKDRPFHFHVKVSGTQQFAPARSEPQLRDLLCQLIERIKPAACAYTLTISPSAFADSTPKQGGMQ
jgi:phage tail-like protein